MKMVKSLLLSSAAGLVAVTAGQAAELPVKAKPVEYVKVCSLYGAGFYYMPGTDMCIKVGGWYRTEVTWNANGNLGSDAFNANVQNRTTNNLTVRARGYITADAREQTAYGTARAYIAVGINTSDVGLNGPSNTFSSNRAFLQWAGMTAGLAASFYDFYCQPCSLYRAGNLPASDTGDPGWWVWGYTAQLGNGVSATLAAEARRVTQIIGAGYTSIATGTEGGIAPGDAIGGGYGGWQAPDVVGNFRVDQAWGSAQVMAAWHDVNPLYYGGTPTSDAIVASGHPSDASGWAVGAGLKVLFPQVAQGDYFQSQVNYTQGALRYLYFTPDGNFGWINGQSEAYGVITDCVYGGAVGTTATSCQLTTAWGFNAAYEHYWTPAVHQSLVGAYYATRYNAVANNMLCSLAGDGSGVGSGASALAGCNNNWDDWVIGSRLQWDVTKSFYLGVEVLYNYMDSATTSNSQIWGYRFGPLGATDLAESSASNWVVSVRAHKDFLP